MRSTRYNTFSSQAVLFTFPLGFIFISSPAPTKVLSWAALVGHLSISVPDLNVTSGMHPETPLLCPVIHNDLAFLSVVLFTDNAVLGPCSRLPSLWPC